MFFDERDPDQVKLAVKAGEDIPMRCLELGGIVSGEHDIGVEKIPLMNKQFTPEDLQAMKDLRHVFDPQEKHNPNKMFPSARRCVDFVARKQVSV